MIIKNKNSLADNKMIDTNSNLKNFYWVRKLMCLGGYCSTI